MKVSNYFLLGIIFLFNVSVKSATLKVPSSYSTIQEAIDAAQNGDTVLVADGIYEGNIGFNSVDFVIVKSESGPENCIIDCQGLPFPIGFIFNSQDDNSIVEGFTIKNAMMGIWAYANSSPTIKNNIIESCTTGINSTSFAEPLIISNIIKNCINDGGGYAQFGGGISLYYSSATIINNQIINNSASKGGGIFCEYGSPEIRENNISGNTGGGIYCENAYINIESNQIKNNESAGEFYTEQHGGGIYLLNTTGWIIMNEIGNNTAYDGGGIYFDESSPNILKNKIFGNRGCGIYCNNSSPIISGNEISLNQSDQGTGLTGYCTSDNHQRTDKCYVGNMLKGAAISIQNISNPLISNNIIHHNEAFSTPGIFSDNSSVPTILNNHLVYNSLQAGGVIYVENNNTEIVNNIIAFTSFSGNETNGLSRWYKNNLFLHYTYDGAKIDYVTYYFGFINNGPSGEVQLSGCAGLNTSVWAETGEMFWVESKSYVTEFGHGGGLDVTVSLEGSGSFEIIYQRPTNQPLVTEGCINTVSTITSMGISCESITGAGIVANNTEDLPEIAHNIFYGNPGGAIVFFDAEEAPYNIIDENGNILEDPSLKGSTYELMFGSPCIDAGTPELNGLDPGETDFVGNSRVYDGNGDGTAVIDIGAYEAQELAIETEEYVSICQGEIYEGHTESGDFQRTLTATTGADSIVTTHLSVYPTYEIELPAAICEGDEFMGYSEEGDYPQTFQTINECDSTIVIHLTVYLAFEPTFTSDGERLTADQEYEAYQWYNSDGIIKGATNREFVLEETGHYRLEATNENGCTYSSDEVYVNMTSVENFKNGNFAYSLFPNPANGFVHFKIDAAPPQEITLKLSNMLGQTIEEIKLNHSKAGDKTFFDVTEIKDGIYQVIIMTNENTSSQKICIIR
ncbi:MAG: right-handed parallel beta-helix repeat-containing protein [Prolixibacteraceae bacterium]|nr:right-handed parallel beta-helix repeat-containing protein [Prolixibacteraceae bacterium]